VARGAAQAQRKRAQQDVKPKKKAKAAPSWEEQLFFSRLRRHAKIAYVLLAVVFAGGFVFLGVGSGSSGIGDLLQGNLFGNNGSSTSSQISDKQKAIQQHPRDINLYLDLAGLYQTDGKESQAIAALKNAQKVAPKNVDVMNRLAGIYSGQAAREGDRYNTLLTAYGQNAAAPPGVDTSSELGQAITSDPYTQGLQRQLNEAYTKVTGGYTKAESVYQQAAAAAKGTSGEPTALLNWASAATSANDLNGAITAYERFLKVAPNNTNAPTVRQTLAQLKASARAAQR
jgi:cytochrome c-type biogenesis protein CcmH/NrfG